MLAYQPTLGLVFNKPGHHHPAYISLSHLRWALANVLLKSEFAMSAAASYLVFLQKKKKKQNTTTKSGAIFSFSNWSH